MSNDYDCLNATIISIVKHIFSFVRNVMHDIIKIGETARIVLFEEEDTHFELISCYVMKKIQFLRTLWEVYVLATVSY